MADSKDMNQDLNEDAETIIQYCNESNIEQQDLNPFRDTTNQDLAQESSVYTSYLDSNNYSSFQAIQNGQIGFEIRIIKSKSAISPQIQYWHPNTYTYKRLAQNIILQCKQKCIELKGIVVFYMQAKHQTCFFVEQQSHHDQQLCTKLKEAFPRAFQAQLSHKYNQMVEQLKFRPLTDDEKQNFNQMKFAQLINENLHNNLTNAEKIEYQGLGCYLSKQMSDIEQLNCENLAELSVLVKNKCEQMGFHVDRFDDLNARRGLHRWKCTYSFNLEFYQVPNSQDQNGQTQWAVKQIKCPFTIRFKRNQVTNQIGIYDYDEGHNHPIGDNLRKVLEFIDQNGSQLDSDENNTHQVQKRNFMGILTSNYLKNDIKQFDQDLLTSMESYRQEEKNYKLNNRAKLDNGLKYRQAVKIDNRFSQDPKKNLAIQMAKKFKSLHRLYDKTKVPRLAQVRRFMLNLSQGYVRNPKHKQDRLYCVEHQTEGTIQHFKECSLLKRVDQTFLDQLAASNPGGKYEEFTQLDFSALSRAEQENLHKNLFKAGSSLITAFQLKKWMNIKKKF